MRELKRIDRILKLIKAEWKKSPDMRFGQLLINLGISPDTYDFWSLEDETLEEHLEKVK